jgi:L-amino acid N-acyltransferase YncA
VLGAVLTAQVEPYADALPELTPHYEHHWREVALDQDRPEAALKPQYATYRERDARGELVLVTLRERGQLCGYFLCIVAPALHYADCLTAHMDIIYVCPEVRGRHGGMRLIRAMGRELYRRGVKRWFAAEKIGRSSGLGRMFELAGFRPVETHFSLWLGD